MQENINLCRRQPVLVRFIHRSTGASGPQHALAVKHHGGGTVKPWPCDQAYTSVFFRAESPPQLIGHAIMYIVPESMYGGGMYMFRIFGIIIIIIVNSLDLYCSLDQARRGTRKYQKWFSNKGTLQN